MSQISRRGDIAQRCTESLGSSFHLRQTGDLRQILLLMVSNLSLASSYER